MTPKLTPWILSIAWLVTACMDAGTRESSATAAPMATIDALLELHGARGKRPEERSKSAQQAPVDVAALKCLFSDYESHDPFLANLYVGFVVGAFARHQEVLLMTKRGHRAIVHAGGLPVTLTLKKDNWLIVLDKTIPQSVKERAKKERDRLTEQPLATAQTPGQ